MTDNETLTHDECELVRHEAAHIIREYMAMSTRVRDAIGTERAVAVSMFTFIEACGMIITGGVYGGLGNRSLNKSTRQIISEICHAIEQNTLDQFADFEKQLEKTIKENTHVN